MPPTKRSKNTRTAEEDTQGKAVQLQSPKSVSPILGEIISMNKQQFRDVFLTALRDELVKWEKDCQQSDSHDSKKTLPPDSGSRIWKSIVKEAERFLEADDLVDSQINVPSVMDFLFSGDRHILKLGVSLNTQEQHTIARWQAREKLGAQSLKYTNLKSTKDALATKFSKLSTQSYPYDSDDEPESSSPRAISATTGISPTPSANTTRSFQECPPNDQNWTLEPSSVQTDEDPGSWQTQIEKMLAHVPTYDSQNPPDWQFRIEQMLADVPPFDYMHPASYPGLHYTPSHYPTPQAMVTEGSSTDLYVPSNGDGGFISTMGGSVFAGTKRYYNEEDEFEAGNTLSVQLQ